MLRSLRLSVMLLALVGTTTACASRSYAYRRGDIYQQQRFERRAYDNGYHEGLEHGRDDARHGRAFSYTRHDEYRDADEGYDRDDGSRRVYQNAFRDGFRTGYMEAFRQSAGPFRRPGRS